MINEKMLELLILTNIFEYGQLVIRNAKQILIYNDKQYNYDKLLYRLQELEDEFLSPYIINSDSKE